MNLNYRGIACNPATPSLEISTTEQVGMVNGRRVYAQPYQMAYRQHAPMALNYRGRHYSH